MLLNSHISAYTRCLAEKVCGLVWSTWGTSQGEDKLGARDKILNTKVARRACAGQTFPLCRVFASCMTCTQGVVVSGIKEGDYANKPPPPHANGPPTRRKNHGHPCQWPPFRERRTLAHWQGEGMVSAI